MHTRTCEGIHIINVCVCGLLAKINIMPISATIIKLMINCAHLKFIISNLFSGTRRASYSERYTMRGCTYTYNTTNTLLESAFYCCGGLALHWLNVLWMSRTVFHFIINCSTHYIHVYILLSYTAFWEWTIWGSCIACCNISKGERKIANMVNDSYFLGKLHGHRIKAGHMKSWNLKYANWLCVGCFENIRGPAEVQELGPTPLR